MEAHLAFWKSNMGEWNAKRRNCFKIRVLYSKNMLLFIIHKCIWTTLLWFAIPFSDLERVCVALNRKQRKLAFYIRWDIYIREAVTVLHNNHLFCCHFHLSYVSCLKSTTRTLDKRMWNPIVITSAWRCSARPPQEESQLTITDISPYK
jgi:hypothetical protein